MGEILRVMEAILVMGFLVIVYQKVKSENEAFRYLLHATGHQSLLK